MTVIVGYQTKAGVYLAGDRSSTYAECKDSHSSNIRIANEPKIFLKGPLDCYLYGCCGSFRQLQLLKYSFKEPSIDYSQLSTTSFLINKYIPALKKFLESKDVIENSCLSSFLLAIDGELFCISDDFSIEKYVEPFTAIGFGFYYALGSLHATNDKRIKIPPKEKVKLAVDAAIKYNESVCGPTDILFQKKV